MRMRALLIVGALTATTLSGAYAQQRQQPGMMTGGDMPMGDQAQMCEMHKQMEGKSPQQQQAMMEQFMKSRHGKADPETAARYRDMMEKNCPAMRQGTK